MKSLKSLIIPFVVMLVLVAGVIVWAINKNEDEEVVNENTSIPLLQYTSSMITDFSVEKSDGSIVNFVACFNDDGVNDFELVNASDDSLQFSDSSIISYISILVNYSATSKIDNPGDLSSYGLENPDYTVRFTTNTGASETVYIGSTTYDGTGCYIKIDGIDGIYITAAIKRVYADYSEIDFLSTQLLNIDYTQIATVQYDRESDNTHILTTCDMSSTGEPYYDVIEPYHIGTSPYFENLVEYVATLEIGQFVDIPEDELADYGLDNPNYHFKFTMDTGETTDIYFSNLMNQYYYGYCSAVDGYFQLSQLQVDGLDTSILILLDSYISYNAASAVSKIEISRDGREYTMELDVDSAISDGDATVTLNGRNMKITTSEGRSYAAMAFESFATIDLGGLALDDNPTLTDDNSALTFTVFTKDYQVTTYDFVERNSDSYYVFMNGEYSYFYVSGRELFRNSGTDTYSYGVWEAFELANYAIDNQLSGVFDVPEDYGENT